MPIPVTKYLRSVLGVNLTPAQADANIANLAEAIEELNELIADAGTVNQITGVVLSGYDLTFTRASGPPLGPVTLPSSAALMSTVETVATTTHVPDLTDENVYHRSLHADGCEITLQAQDDVAWSDGAELHYVVAPGGGQLTWVGDTGVTINPPLTGFVAATQAGIEGAMVSFKRVALDEWDAKGGPFEPE